MLLRIRSLVPCLCRDSLDKNTVMDAPHPGKAVLDSPKFSTVPQAKSLASVPSAPVSTDKSRAQT